jgi:hypothetical protein
MVTATPKVGKGLSALSVGMRGDPAMTAERSFHVKKEC